MKNHEKGMSLLEVLVGTTLLAFVCLGVLTFIGTSMAQNQLSLQRSTATGLASARVEQLLSHANHHSTAQSANYILPDESRAPVNPHHPRDLVLISQMGQIDGFPKYSRTTTVSWQCPIEGMQCVRCDVSWYNLAQNQLKTQTVVTYFDADLVDGRGASGHFPPSDAGPQGGS